MGKSRCLSYTWNQLQFSVEPTDKRFGLNIFETIVYPSKILYGTKSYSFCYVFGPESVPKTSWQNILP